MSGRNAVSRATFHTCFAMLLVDGVIFLFFPPYSSNSFVFPTTPFPFYWYHSLPSTCIQLLFPSLPSPFHSTGTILSLASASNSPSLPFPQSPPISFPFYQYHSLPSTCVQLLSKVDSVTQGVFLRSLAEKRKKLDATEIASLAEFEVGNGYLWA